MWTPNWLYALVYPGTRRTSNRVLGYWVPGTRARGFLVLQILLLTRLFSMHRSQWNMVHIALGTYGDSSPKYLSPSYLYKCTWYPGTRVLGGTKQKQSAK